MRPITTSLSLSVLLVLSAAVWSDDEPKSRGVRRFEFRYAGAITELPPTARARIWLPEPSSDADQQVRRMAVVAPPGGRGFLEAAHGNKVLYFDAVANSKGEIPFEVVYQVTRQEVLIDQLPKVRHRAAERFQAASTLIPVDVALRGRLLGKGVSLPPTPLEVGRVIYDATNKKVRYDKPAGGKWGRGDALWACASGYGNCTDFHSLFLSACRTSGIAGKFEIGFPIPAGKSGQVSGYHCWARFLDGDRWVPVDISEADKNPQLNDYYFGNLTADRVLFSVGRDLELEPPPATGKVNFFVYPHVEVDGKVHRMFRKGFSFREL